MQGWQCGKGMIYFRPTKDEQGSMHEKKKRKKKDGWILVNGDLEPVHCRTG